ncbi:choice_anch_A, choice-of-anchor A domain [Fimbriimonadaceae bacterium]
MNIKGSALIAVVVLSAVGATLIVGSLMVSVSNYNLAMSRSNSEAALLLAEAGLNEELIAIGSKTSQTDASTWVTVPAKTSGEPYEGRKGTVPGVSGNYWVYGTTSPTVKTAWTGTGPLYLVAVAKVGGAIRTASLEVKVTQSAGSTPTTSGSDFNAIVFGNVDTKGGHSEGPIAVGGNWNGPYEINQHSASAKIGTDTRVGLYNGGQITRGNAVKKVFNGFNAYIGGQINCILTMLGNGTIYNTVGTNWFTTEESKWQSQSDAIGAMTDMRLDVSDMNNVRMDVTKNTLNGNVKVYWVDDKDLAPLKTLDIQNMTASDTVIINVEGSNVDWGWQVNAPFKNRILWNFQNVANIKVANRHLTGMMLAPKAHVQQYNNIQGTMIAKRWSNYGAPEMHFTNFKYAGAFAAQSTFSTTVGYKGNYNAQ